MGFFVFCFFFFIKLLLSRTRPCHAGVYTDKSWVSFFLFLVGWLVLFHNPCVSVSNGMHRFRSMDRNADDHPPNRIQDTEISGKKLSRIVRIKHRPLNTTCSLANRRALCPERMAFSFFRANVIIRVRVCVFTFTRRSIRPFRHRRERVVCSCGSAKPVKRVKTHGFANC